MKSITVLFGTESGNSEMVAEDIVADLEGEFDIDAFDMADFDPADFSTERFYMVVCSTHGEGELPGSARPFFESLEAAQPDLAGVRYAMFGLGDSSYENYSHGNEIIDAEFTRLGATRVGAYGRHDANTGTLPNDSALEWSREIADSLAELPAMA